MLVMKKKSPKSAKTVKIQVPIKEELKTRAEEVADEMGFGSVQEVIRLFLAGYVKGEYGVGFQHLVSKENNSHAKADLST